MFTSPIVTKTFQLSAVAVALALAGCGGGGGGHNDTVQPAVTGSSSSSSSSSSTAAVNSTAITLTDTSGNATTTISSAGATAKVTITDASGKGISGALVTFSGTDVTFGTTNGAVLTNANGVATISVKPTTSTDTGSYTMTATATYNGNSATSTALNYSLQAVNTSISGMTAATTSLASGGSTNITLSTLDATSKAIQPNVAINFTATCGTFTNSTATSDSQGNIITTYKAVDASGNLCSGAQTITATTTNGTAVSIPITVAAIQASSIVYTSTSDVQLATKNSGSSSSGQIEFTVYANGIPAPNQSVIVSETYAPTDFSFVTLGNQATQTVQSDSNGKVTISLYPGAIPGPVEIKAALASDSSVSALSKNVSVVNSRATQNGITLTFGKNVLLNNTTDSTSVVMHLTNRNGTNVPAGTVVNFVAEGGKIDPTCSTDDNGTCTVNFTSQNPRPTNGRVSVLAYLEGDKDYIDVNGDNQYTAGTDTLTRNIGDTFRDDNENNIYDSSAGEFIYKRGATGTCGNTAVTSLLYPTDRPTVDTNNMLKSDVDSNLTNYLSYLSQPNIDNTCDTGLSATLRHQEIFGLADDTPTFDGLTANGTFYMYGNSAETVSMPSGTTISVSGEDNTSSNNLTCSPKLYGNATVPANVNLFTVNAQGNFFAQTADVHYVLQSTGCASGDRVLVTVTAPNGKATTTYLPL